MLWRPSQSIPKESDTMSGLSRSPPRATESRCCGPWDRETELLVPPSSCDKTGQKQPEEKLRARTLRNLLTSWLRLLFSPGPPACGGCHSWQSS